MRIRILLALILSTLFLSATAQITIVIDSFPDYTPSTDPIYITGNFNRWHPGDDNYMLHRNDQNLPEITLEGFPEGATIFYKFTRGNWDTVEKGPDGSDIPGRSYTVGNGRTVHEKVYHWADRGKYVSTAAWNVVVMDQAFYIPQLDRTRRIILYLPPDYHTSRKRYPVLYMHDGQNIFDRMTAYEEEWQVDETLNALAADGHTVPIVVGIDNDPHRRGDEYLPYNNPDYAGGEGDEYVDFIVQTLKPYIDARYRTLPGRDNTGIMGSSLGGVISWYAALKYQEVFGKAGLFSPAYWANYSKVWTILAETGFRQNIRFYQNAGDQEGDDYLIPMAMMKDSLNHYGFHEVKNTLVSGGHHVVATWARDFAHAYLWLFDTPTAIIQPDHPGFTIYPNPVKDLLKIKYLPNPTEIIKITIIDTQGRTLIEQDQYNEGIQVNGIKPGLYILRIETSGGHHTLPFLKN